MADKVRINPALLAAVEHYAEGRYNFAQPTLYVHTDDKGYQSAWPLERACGIAAGVLAAEDLACLKLKVLKDGLKQYGMEALYERIMGEKLDADDRRER